MSHETAVDRHTRYMARLVKHLCTDCPDEARQAIDGRWMSLCAGCAQKQQRRHRRRYRQLLAEHKCVSCHAPAAQHADGSWYTRCAKHMLAIATYDGAQAAKKAARKKEDALCILPA